MITFIDLGPKATAHLFLRIPVPLSGGGWAWGESPAFKGVLGRDFVYSADECKAVIHAYGRSMGMLLQRLRQVDRFTITAKGPVTGSTLGLREYQWAPVEREFQPAGEYMCGWRSAVKTYFVQTGELFPHQRFEARPAGLPIHTTGYQGPSTGLASAA
ncbi:hypothetical protein [Streptomyces sp. NPDC003832]